MKTSNTLLTIFAIAGALFYGTASAQGAFADVTTPGATYSAVSNAPVVATLSRAEVRAGIVAFQNNPISADGQYRFVGGESGWELIPPMYERVGDTMKLMPVMRGTPAAMRGTPADFNENYRMFNPSSSS